MDHRELSVLMAALFVTSLVTGIVAAEPPRPGTEDNGLTENESATLWSRDADNYISQETHRQRYGENRSAIHQVANGTDITFKRPPATAATWTRNDFEDLDAGGAETSVHPSHADLEDGIFIEDAHATIFAVQPSTRGHLESGETPLYIAPNGTMRGFVDYRVRVPNGSSSGNTTIDWSITEHEIDEVRLKKDGETIATQDGSHTPALDYQIEDDWSANLTLEAEISVRLKKLSGLIKATGRTSTSPTGQNHETFRTRLTLRSTTFRRIPTTPSIPTVTLAFPSSSPGRGRVHPDRRR